MEAHHILGAGVVLRLDLPQEEMAKHMALAGQVVGPITPHLIPAALEK
jgi:hypothetical protein